MNNHYVPRLTLRRFGDHICTYQVKTGEYRENVKPEQAFCEKGFYTDEVEEKLNRRIESQFGSLFSNKLNKAESRLELSREELRLTKKFLLISVIRSVGNEELMQKERHYYDNLRDYAYAFACSRGMSEQDARTDAQSRDFDPPFQEKIIPDESDFDYWMRTLNVILDTDGSPEEILKHPSKTYPAHRWAQVINNGYLAFWDSEFHHNEFIITDIGMTSENELGWNGVTVHNTKKTLFTIDLLSKENDPAMRQAIINNIFMRNYFTENFMMFPISAKRMIVEIDPFYKFRQMYAWRYSMPALSSLTVLDNEDLFFPNDVRYVLPQGTVQPNYHPDDRYIYQIKKLTARETQYCNALFLDRIDTYCGFSSLNKAVRSIIHYKRLNEPPYTPRVDYTGLYKIIEQRYGGNLNV